MSKYTSAFNISDFKKGDNAHSKVVGLIDPESKVLDFGCASGYMGKFLKKDKGCEVWGIEINKEDAKLAKKHLKKVIVANIEDVVSWRKELKKEKFDAAIFADVLEHLKNPLEVLKAARKLLKKSGYVVMSIPNVAHLSLRIELLLGQWRYESLGLLDDTHVRFFTHAEIMELLHRAGFYVDKVDYTKEDIPEEVIQEYMDKRGIKLTKNLKKVLYAQDALVYQYIVRATVKKKKGYEKKKVDVLPKLVMNEWANKKFELQSAKDKNKELQKRLNKIESSRAYKLWQTYASFKRKVLKIFERFLG